MPILNIELSEFDALRDRVKQLESENRNLSEAIEEKAEDGRLRVIKKTGDIRDNLGGDTEERLKQLTREDYERFGLHTNYTPPSPVNKKKRKAKAKAQKQSRKKNRKH